MKWFCFYSPKASLNSTVWFLNWPKIMNSTPIALAFHCLNIVLENVCLFFLAVSSVFLVKQKCSFYSFFRSMYLFLFLRFYFYFEFSFFRFPALFFAVSALVTVFNSFPFVDLWTFLCLSFPNIPDFWYLYTSLH